MILNVDLDTDLDVQIIKKDKNGNILQDIEEDDINGS